MLKHLLFVFCSLCQDILDEFLLLLAHLIFFSCQSKFFINFRIFYKWFPSIGQGLNHHLKILYWDWRRIKRWMNCLRKVPCLLSSWVLLSWNVPSWWMDLSMNQMRYISKLLLHPTFWYNLLWFNSLGWFSLHWSTTWDWFTAFLLNCCNDFCLIKLVWVIVHLQLSIQSFGCDKVFLPCYCWCIASYKSWYVRARTRILFRHMAPFMQLELFASDVNSSIYMTWQKFDSAFYRRLL